MKNQIGKLLALTLLTFLCAPFSTPSCLAQKVEVDIEKVKEKCRDKPYDERVRVTVSKFTVTTHTTTQEFGDNLATMFTNALHEINCFRVLESISNLDNLTDEISLGQQGYTNAASSPTGGKMLGAQVIFIGEITEFAEGANTTGVLGISLQRNKAKVGFIVKAINPETRDVYFTKSIETESSKPGGYNGLTLFGIGFAGSTKTNAAIADAVERGIIRAAYEVAEEIDNIPFPKANDGLAAKKEWNVENCPVLSSGNAPRVMVIVPENYNINNYRNYNFSDLAVETAIIRNLTESGFTVIDPAMYASQRKSARFNEAFRNPMAAASLGSEFGAEIVIVGDASSTVAGRGSMASCRARVDTKAISTSNSSIIASNGFDAGATDVSEHIAAKKALTNAGDMMAGYVIERICTNSTSINVGNTGPTQSMTYLHLGNATLMKIKKLSDLLQTNKQVKGAKRTSFKNQEGTIEIRHEGTTDDIVDFLLVKGFNLCEVTGIEGNKLTATLK